MALLEVMVTVTLSESFENLVWIAETHTFDLSQAVLHDGSRPMKPRAVADAMPVTLHSEKFWGRIAAHIRRDHRKTRQMAIPCCFCSHKMDCRFAGLEAT